jgi:hypothetical protein
MMVRIRLLSVAALAVALLATSSSFAAKKSGAITKPKFDPEAPVVKLFDGMESGQLESKLIMKNEFSGNLLIENKTDGPLTVQMPDSFVGVHVLNQFGGGLGGGGLGGGQQGGGGGQTAGGGAGGGGLGGGGLGGAQGGGGGGFFSIPPEKVVRLPFNSVCLEHGKPTPRPRMEYVIRPVDEFSQDPLLRELLVMVSTGRVSQKAGQAAAWHLANGKSWRELAAIADNRVGRPDTPHFSYADLQLAQDLLANAKVRAEKRKEREAAEPKRAEPAPVRDRTGRVISQR